MQHSDKEIVERAEAMVGLTYLNDQDGGFHTIEAARLTETGFIIKSNKQLFTCLPSQAMSLMDEFAIPPGMPRPTVKTKEPISIIQKNKNGLPRKKPGPAKGFKKQRELAMPQADKLEVSPALSHQWAESVQPEPIHLPTTERPVFATLESTSLDSVQDILLVAMRRTVEDPGFLEQARMLLDLVNAYDCQP